MAFMTLVTFRSFVICIQYCLQFQRGEIKLYYQITTFRALLSFYCRNNLPSVLAIRQIVENFEISFSLYNVQVPVRQRTAQSEAIFVGVQASVVEDCNFSIPRRSQP